MLPELDLALLDAEARTALVVVYVEEFGLRLFPLLDEVELVIGLAQALRYVGYDLVVPAQDRFARLPSGKVVQVLVVF